MELDVLLILWASPFLVVSSSQNGTLYLCHLWNLFKVCGAYGTGCSTNFMGVSIFGGFIISKWYFVSCNSS
ncbi:hypothetical protein RchiOBHm_Chr4g0385321 [Rosa chinensis]|uniref:Uncharacterized protein n=1 Tax=Rosa chinensis TaxID=74649 RepID=A0A2P6QNX0_ROSCH|nr:hypothetical protein RchiOBHm_Chr4g0385321 [Rosa chinensis]